MFFNFLKTAFRHMVKNRLYSIITIFSLVMGLICFMVIGIYVYSELSFDRFHTQSKHIYRIIQNVKTDFDTKYYANVHGPLTGVLKENTDDVKAVVRFWNYWSLGFNVRYQDKMFKEVNLAFTDSTVFDIFDFEFLAGDAQNALTAPHSVVLTESAKRKYFADADPIGKALRINDGYDLFVTGVIKDVPARSHFHYDFFASISTLDQMMWKHELDSWRSGFCFAYILTSDNAAIESIENTMASLQQQHGSNEKSAIRYSLQPLEDIHLNSYCEDELEAGGSSSYLLILVSIALFILLLALLNYINLCMTYFSARVKEISIRTVLGSNRWRLTAQLLGESAMHCLLAIMLSLGITELVLPWFTPIFGDAIEFSIVPTIALLVSIFMLWLLVTLCAGLLPALIFSSAKTRHSLKGKWSTPVSRGTGRKVLVAFQLFIASGLMIGATLIHYQLDYMVSFDTRYDHENIIILPVNQTPISSEHYDSFINTISTQPGVVSATGLRTIAGFDHIKEPFRFSNKAGETVEQQLPFLLTRLDFLKTFGITLLSGRDFSATYATDENESVLINQALAQKMGLEIDDVIGQNLTHPGWGTLNIIGVVQDFNFESLHAPVKPLVIKMIWPHRHHALTDYIAVRLAPGSFTRSIQAVQETWYSLAPQLPFDYYLLENKLATFYKDESRLGTVSSIFTICAFVIACFGLIGVVSFIAERRTKEIAVRKILGASSKRLFSTLSAEFIVLVFLANAAAWPITFVLIHRWLSNFAFRCPFPYWIFPAAVLVTLTLTLAAIFYHIMRVAFAEPTKYLRYE
jgi:putative ABC transport system permease protein